MPPGPPTTNRGSHRALEIQSGLKNIAIPPRKGGIPGGRLRPADHCKADRPHGCDPRPLVGRTQRLIRNGGGPDRRMRPDRRPLPRSSHGGDRADVVIVMPHSPTLSCPMVLLGKRQARGADAGRHCFACDGSAIPAASNPFLAVMGLSRAQSCGTSGSPEQIAFARFRLSVPARARRRVVSRLGMPGT